MKDLLIIGGGIVGAGIARDAALRGLSVTLIERKTVGWGTSSRSSRLIHGGIRYLETGDIALVRESLHERATLLRIAPHLVWPTTFLFVIDRGQWWQQLRIGVGVLLYRILAGRHALGSYRPMARSGLMAREPLLSNSPIGGGALYQDARCDDLGLVQSNIRAAAAAGATVLEHTTCTITADENSIHASLANGELIEARAMVLAVGPWTDEVRAAVGLAQLDLIGGTKGIHLTIPLQRLPLSTAIALRHPDDQRVMFCIPEPENQRVVVGTTDTITEQSPDSLTVDQPDIDYLLRAVNHLFPDRQISAGDILDTWVGLRPLLQQQGAASSRSREDLMLHEGRVLTVAGGKLTTFRAMAEAAVDMVGEILGRELPRSTTGDLPLP
jgi:glycerol-3-phosphate dehydrogenase